MKPMTAVVLVLTIAAISLAAAAAAAQDAPTSPPPTTPATPTTAATSGTDAEVDALRDQLKTAYQHGDANAMLKYLHPQVVITFPDGTVLEGRDALAGYYDRMLKAPGHRVQSYTSDPVVSHRYVHGDAVVSYGKMNDHYVLTDGTSF